LGRIQIYVVQGDERQLAFGIVDDGCRYEWRFDDLYAAAREKERKLVPIESLNILDEDLWFGRTGRKPTLRNIAGEVTRIGNSDGRLPAIIVSGLGLVDGSHRAVKAYLQGEEHLECVEFTLEELREIPHVAEP